MPAPTSSTTSKQKCAGRISARRQAAAFANLEVTPENE